MCRMVGGRRLFGKVAGYFFYRSETSEGKCVVTW